jgi:hypothetical protein
LWHQKQQLLSHLQPSDENSVHKNKCDIQDHQIKIALQGRRIPEMNASRISSRTVETRNDAPFLGCTSNMGKSDKFVDKLVTCTFEITT